MEFLDGTEAEALFHRLARGRSPETLGTSFLWILWLKWYRETAYPYKKFIATESDFIQEMKLSLKTSKPIVNDRPQTSHFRTGHAISEDSPYKLILGQHILRCFTHVSKGPQREFSFNKRSTRNALFELLAEVGQLEVQLLEHHEPIRAWFDSLTQKLQGESDLVPGKQLPHFPTNHDNSTRTQLRRLIHRTYLQLIIPFFGSIRIIHYKLAPDKVGAWDPLIQQGWKFIQELLDSWTYNDIFTAMETKYSTLKTPTEAEHSPGRALLQIVLKRYLKDFCVKFTFKDVWQIWELLSNSNGPYKAIQVEPDLKAYQAYKRAITVFQKSVKASLQDFVLNSRVKLHEMNSIHQA
ncbi:hypothetical protein CROQUDRAFT_59212 [Cronartium quercuum f. sp. fusiforme G11]|uniref:Uncharacterized protein n=1 Tax=Cronartium quercuum f. sp. fusiforme G11 TaxID=708437 RepID=A0A9P6TEL2_9BASI|nr:hypothetical protein CROQUDRAFT_59212 [Cronartium quercuum f. sp. fusiforme G11]